VPSPRPCTNQRTLPTGECLAWTVFTGGRLWFTYTDCAGGWAGLGFLDPASGAFTLYAPTSPFVDKLAAQSNRPGRVTGFVPGNSGIPVDAWDLTTAPPTLVARVFPDAPLSNCADAATIDNAKEVVLACGAPYEHPVFHTRDATYDTALPSDTYPDAVAASDDGRYVALGVNGIYSDTDVLHVLSPLG
jgi:hypothetical protein